MSRKIVMTALAMMLLLAIAPVMAEDEEPAVGDGNLELVEKSRRTEIFADPDVDWSVYARIRLDPATVAFRKNWQRDQNRTQPFKIKTDDMERIKSELSALFDEVFSEELTANGGYVMVDENGDDVLRIAPQIVDLDVYAPDSRSSPGMSRSYADSVGRMTLKLEMFDSVTGDLIATASDSREAPRRGYMQWTNSVTNRAEAKRMLERWARDLREGLDEARTAPPAGK
jgi:hypothetical protein